jgi:Mg/Co/Ni transporter MgtE
MATSYAPSRKVGSGALTGAVSIILVWVLNSFVFTGGTKITGEIASALTTILTFLVSYFVPEPA